MAVPGHSSLTAAQLAPLDQGLGPGLLLAILVLVALMVGWMFLWNHILQRRVEERSDRLAASEAFLERLFRQSPYGMWVADRHGTMIMMNDACERLFGISEPQKVLGRYNVLRDNIVEEQNLLGRIRRAFEGETVTLTDRYDPGRLEGFALPSKPLYLRTTFTPIHSRSGEVNHVLVMHEDITERDRAEAELRDRNRKVLALLEAFSALSSTLDPQELLAQVSHQALAAFPQTDWGGFFLYEAEADELVLTHPLGHGTSPLEVRLPRGAGVAGKAFEEGKLIHLPTPAAVEEAVADLPTGPSGAWEKLCGGRRPQAAVGVPLEARNRYIGVLGLVTTEESLRFNEFDARLLAAFADHAAATIDTAYLYEALVRKSSELEGVNRRLHAALEELKLLDEMKTNLLSNVSHELRTPLIAILGYTDLILQGRLGPLTEDQRNRLEICLRNAERLSKRIEDLLNFSRTEMGEMHLEISRFDLNEVLREAVESLQTYATEKGVRLEVELTEEPIEIRGDREKILQVFSNLLDNAVKFNRSEGSVQVHSKPIGKGLARVNISDTGIGIPEEALEKIFDRFYQVDSSLSRPYGGTGIGLSLVRSIVDIHGGRVRVQSTVGTGSTFTVVLPVYDSTRDSGRYVLPQPAGAGGRSGKAEEGASTTLAGSSPTDPEG